MRLWQRLKRMYWVWGALVLASAWSPGALAQAKVVQGKPVYHVATQQKAMALTINVVWGTEYVPKMLHTLVADHVKATFMLGGAWAAAHPELAKDIAAAGMEIGNHGWAHGHPTLYSEAQNYADITRTNKTLQDITGTDPTVYAPPYGEFNKTVIQAANRAHMSLTMWTIDTIDWRPSSSSGVILQRVAQKAAPGSIVLMHPTERTAEALPSMVRRLQGDGYQLVTVSELLNMGEAKTDAE